MGIAQALVSPPALTIFDTDLNDGF